MCNDTSKKYVEFVYEKLMLALEAEIIKTASQAPHGNLDEYGARDRASDQTEERLDHASDQSEILRELEHCTCGKVIN